MHETSGLVSSDVRACIAGWPSTFIYKKKKSTQKQFARQLPITSGYCGVLEIVSKCCFLLLLLHLASSMARVDSAGTLRQRSGMGFQVNGGLEEEQTSLLPTSMLMTLNTFTGLTRCLSVRL